jgi:hypothetical protein
MVWTLMFKTEDKARLNVSTLNQSPLGQVTRFVDDFGQECDIITDELKGWMLEDMEQSKLAHIERALHQARTQAKGAEIADSDPVLAQARRRAQGGMPIMQPMPTGFSPNGRFPS